MLKKSSLFTLISCSLFSIIFGILFFSNIPKVQADGIQFKPQVTIGDFNKETSYTISSNSIGEYINSIYKYAIGTVGILAVVVMMFGGMLWLTAGGSQEKIGSAKSWIGASLTGLVLTLASYTILNTINPDLVNFKPIQMAEVVKIDDNAKIICCDYNTGTINYDTKGNRCPLGSDKCDDGLICLKKAIFNDDCLYQYCCYIPNDF